MEKGLILTPLTSDHRTNSAAALKEVRKSVFGKPGTRHRIIIPVQGSPCKKKKKKVDLDLSSSERQKDKQVMCHPG